MADVRKVYTVYETTNEYGARGALVGRFTSEAFAKEAAKGRGWYGSEGAIQAMTVVRVDGEWYELTTETPVDLDVDLIARERELKASALAKLSADERRALGLKA